MLDALHAAVYAHQLASATRSQCHAKVWNELSLGRAILPIPSRDD
jgi:hypothetical protein